jgi:hypothetical protein
MAVETRVYDNEHGDPVVVMVTTGTFDVSRLVGLMEKGRCEDGARAEAIIRGVRRHNGGRSALKVLRDHGGPDLLEPVVPAEVDRARRIHLAISDPGAIVPRQRERRGSQDWEYESVSHWQMRAVMAVIGPWLADVPELATR